MANLPALNALSADDAVATLRLCCGSKCWAERVAACRPFVDESALEKAAIEIEHSLSPTDWLEAFAAHPKIGDVDSLKKKFASTATHAAHEQAGALRASDEILRRLAEGNRAYESKFGYIFIVCATGKSAEEMLAILESRLGHSPDEELAIAAAEQVKITRIRFSRLCT